MATLYFWFRTRLGGNLLFLSVLLNRIVRDLLVGLAVDVLATANPLALGLGCCVWNSLRVSFLVRPQLHPTHLVASEQTLNLLLLSR